MLENNVFDTVLVFEGGGMKASYTSGIVNTLLAHEIYFDNVEGASAGASHTVNYLSRDMERTKRSFVDIVKEDNFGGRRDFLKGEGFFNSQYIYNEIAKEGGSLPFDFETFEQNPAKLWIPTYDLDKNATVIREKEDLTDTQTLMDKVKTSSSLPFLMSKTILDDDQFLDGGLSEDVGFLLTYLEEMGFEKFFFVLAYPKGHRATPQKGMRFISPILKNQPELERRIRERYLTYNKVMDEIDRLEAEGKAFCVRPDHLIGKLNEDDIKVLEQNYKDGRAFGEAHVEEWLEFLNLK